MSDSRLRDLERSAAAGDVEAHGQLLRERVRLGQLDAERLELLAYLCWPPAWKALGWQPHGHSGAPGESFRSRLFKREDQKDLYQLYTRFERWVHGLRRWGSTVALRVGAAAARYRWPSWEAQYRVLETAGWDMPCPRERILALLDLIDLHIDFGDRPGAKGFVLAHEGRALRTAGPVAIAFRDLSREDTRIEPVAFANLGIFAEASSYSWLAEALKESCDTDPLADAQPCVGCGRAWPEHRDGHSDHEFEPANDEGAWCRHVARREEAVYQAIRDELVPWATGDHDPVADRIEAARRECAGNALGGQERRKGDP